MTACTAAVHTTGSSYNWRHTCSGRMSSGVKVKVITLTLPTAYEAGGSLLDLSALFPQRVLWAFPLGDFYKAGDSTYRQVGLTPGTPFRAEDSGPYGIASVDSTNPAVVTCIAKTDFAPGRLVRISGTDTHGPSGATGPDWGVWPVSALASGVSGPTGVFTIPANTTGASGVSGNSGQTGWASILGGDYEGGYDPRNWRVQVSNGATEASGNVSAYLGKIVAAGY